MKTSYLNTDLDIIAEFDPRVLLQHLEQLSLTVIGDTNANEEWYATLEVDTAGEKSPEETISMLLTAIEGLTRQTRELWNKCSLREFNIGYDCGDEPWAYADGLDNSTLKRMASAGVTLRLTLYPYRELHEGICEDES